MSRMGAIAQELMEADDSFDDEGWVGEVIPREYIPQPEQKKASLPPFPRQTTAMDSRRQANQT